MPLSVQCVAHDNGMQLYMHGIDRLQVQAALLLICFQVKRVCVDGLLLASRYSIRQHCRASEVTRMTEAVDV